ncbi:hypothetical protein PENSPDRAFT_276237 [Peniophora sp. CONT]|nr:hypothetical protein PENSPDRAFT_276237 [Peniophora sp. CONT]
MCFDRVPCSCSPRLTLPRSSLVPIPSALCSAVLCVSTLGAPLLCFYSTALVHLCTANQINLSSKFPPSFTVQRISPFLAPQVHPGPRLIR